MDISPVAVFESEEQVNYQFFITVGFQEESSAVDLLVEERQLEFFIAELYMVENEDMSCLLEAVNQYNQKYCGITVWVNPDTKAVGAK